MADATAPDLPGYDFQRELGHGGFADVYLYRQHLPSREVAVKVLRQTAASTHERDQFENEANRMAMLSSHPSIVTIYEVGVSPDDRPYLTMEYCPHEHFGRIARANPLTVSRALEVGIKVAAAVETAHRASILHRDVKPANVLLTTYGEPALTDFGIAGGGSVGDQPEDPAVSQGVSIPFGAPEVLAGRTMGDELSDVYSLGATVYALLAGRAPFSTGEQMSERDLVERVLNAPLPPTGRADVPASLERVLAGALARDPAKRYESAAELGRALQGIEAELGLSQTPLRIAGTAAVPNARSSGDDDATRFTGLQRVDPDGTTGRPSTARAGGSSASEPSATAAPPSPPVATPSSSGRSSLNAEAPRLPDGALGERTVVRQRPGRAGTDPGDQESSERSGPSGPTRRWWAMGAAAAVVVVAVAFVLSKGGSESEDPRATTTTVSGSAPLVTGGVPPRPEQVRIERVDGGGQVVTWSLPSAQEGDSYQVFYTDGPGELIGSTESTSSSELRLDVERKVCVTVETIRGGRVSAASTEVCSP